ncbi:YjfB family protein [Sporolactobacillus sp. CPB3-1]|uniref:YjfB family protein n=1 Tax=Sporolactobacillus mangiferae TaxID=2940498 RepID=A0ABT0M8F1_9BACL|nr:YjfB family protein [Sporolactobacillus mangiferae]MCL1630544.1 YjfB family protein [Sporolactobacillus mangiferae]
MDIPSLSIDLNQSLLGQNVSLAVTKMALNSAKQSGAQLVETLQATDPNLGTIIDLKG